MTHCWLLAILQYWRLSPTKLMWLVSRTSRRMLELQHFSCGLQLHSLHIPYSMLTCSNNDIINEKRPATWLHDIMVDIYISRSPVRSGAFHNVSAQWVIIPSRHAISCLLIPHEPDYTYIRLLHCVQIWKPSCLFIQFMWPYAYIHTRASC